MLEHLVVGGSQATEEPTPNGFPCKGHILHGVLEDEYTAGLMDWLKAVVDPAFTLFVIESTRVPPIAILTMQQW
jgi:hypothetical protein